MEGQDLSSDGRVGDKPEINIFLHVDIEKSEEAKSNVAQNNGGCTSS